MRDTNGLLMEELEGLQRRLGRQEKMQEALVGLELEKEVRVLVSGLCLQGSPLPSQWTPGICHMRQLVSCAVAVDVVLC